MLCDFVLTLQKYENHFAKDILSECFRVFKKSLISKNVKQSKNERVLEKNSKNRISHENLRSIIYDSFVLPLWR